MSEESKSVEVELEELKQASAALFAMARLVPWIAFCWNDHNYLKNPEQYAIECCEHYGITGIDKANEWLDGKPFINKETYQLPSQEVGGKVPPSSNFEILKRINEELSVHIGEQRDDYEHDGAYGLQVAPWRAKEEGLPIKKIFLCDGKEWLWNIEFTKKEFKELIDELLAVHDMMED